MGMVLYLVGHLVLWALAFALGFKARFAVAVGGTIALIVISIMVARAYAMPIGIPYEMASVMTLVPISFVVMGEVVAYLIEQRKQLQEG